MTPPGMRLDAVANAGDAIGDAWRIVEPRLARVAFYLTADQDRRDDLLQEAMILLWEKDPTRFELRDLNDYRYVVAMLANRMRRVNWIERCRAVG